MQICEEEEDRVSCRKSLARLSLNNEIEAFKDDVDRTVEDKDVHKSGQLLDKVQNSVSMGKYNKMELELKEAKRTIEVLRNKLNKNM